jgi:hypothetical protein
MELRTPLTRHHETGTLWDADHKIVGKLYGSIGDTMLRRINDADQLQADLTRLRAENAALQKSVADYAANLGDIVTFGTTADVLDGYLRDAKAENAALAKQLSAAEAKLRAVRERVEPFMQTPVTIQLVGNRVETSPLGEALLAIHELSNQLTKEQA